MQQKVWIFGDSYASIAYTKSHAWPRLLQERYDVENNALGGTGPEFMLNLFKKRLNEVDVNKLKNIKLIFLLSHDSRKDFTFLHQPEDQSIMVNVAMDHGQDNYIKSRIRAYKKHKTFIKNFFQKYWIHANTGDFAHLGYVGILKEYSKFFDKTLVIPVFDDFEDSTLYKKFNANIQDTDNFFYAKGKCLYSFEKDINKKLSNHMCEENHKIMYNQLVNWIDNSEPFGTNKLIKIA